MNDIRELREKILERRAAQAEPEPKKFPLRYLLLASFTLVVLVVAAVELI